MLYPSRCFPDDLDLLKAIKGIERFKFESRKACDAKSKSFKAWG